VGPTAQRACPRCCAFLPCLIMRCRSALVHPPPPQVLGPLPPCYRRRAWLRPTDAHAPQTGWGRVWTHALNTLQQTLPRCLLAAQRSHLPPRPCVAV
jgi:hypothetical protein